MYNQFQKSHSPFRSFMKKFLKQRVALISLGVVLFILALGFIGPLFAPYDPHRPVTEQYTAKGIEVDNLTSTRLDAQGVFSDGTTLEVHELPQLIVESEDRQIASARASANGIIVIAYRQGDTSLVIKSGDVSTVVRANVSAEEENPAISQLIADQFVEPLELNQSVQLNIKAILTDGSELESLAEILSYVQEYTQEQTEQKDDGFGRPKASIANNAIKIQSLDPNVLRVSEAGEIEAVGEGEASVKVSLGQVSTVVPIAVNTTISESVLTAIQPAELMIQLTDIHKHQPPSSTHWFGTDHQNRDILSRIIYGTKQTLLIGFVSVALGAFIGTICGLLAGYYGRWVDSLFTRMTDILLAFPGILLAIAVIAILGAGLINIIVAVAVFTIPIFIRIVRASTLSLKEKAYVEAAKSIGVKDFTIILRHIFPGTLSVMMVYLTMRMGTAILIGAALSFLGLGGDVTAPEWGAMLSSAKDNSRNLFHPTFFPGLAIVITVLSFNLLGDGLRDALDPKLKD